VIPPVPVHPNDPGEPRRMYAFHATIKEEVLLLFDVCVVASVAPGCIVDGNTLLDVAQVSRYVLADATDHPSGLDRGRRLPSCVGKDAHIEGWRKLALWALNPQIHV
jgi:hypothetical protein